MGIKAFNMVIKPFTRYHHFSLELRAKLETRNIIDGPVLQSAAEVGPIWTKIGPTVLDKQVNADLG
jgi:hypothetical protein